jgi:putative ABC transport system permease protein
MLKNNLLLAWRHLLKNKTYTAINIFGLAVGIAACLLIWRILRYETSFNQNFSKNERIARVIFSIKGGPNGDQRIQGLPVPGMIAIQANLTQLEASSRIREDWPTFTVPNPAGGAPLKKTKLDEGEISLFAEPDFLKIFDFKWLAGDANTALNETRSIVLNRKVAEICFGTPEKALNQTLILDNNVPVIVRGVIENLPKNCDIPIVSLMSYATLEANAKLYRFENPDWDNISSSSQMYVLFKEKNQISSLETVLAQVGQTEFADAAKRRGMPSIEAKFQFQPLNEMHYDEEVGLSVSQPISRARLSVLALIGLLVLAMACFNFINLATALAAVRSREVGVRKAIGGAKSALIAQFMTETSLIVGFSVLLGAFMAKVAAPLLKQISDVPDAQPFFSDPKIWVFLTIVTLSVTLLSGLWPSFVLAGMNPIAALKNKLNSERQGKFSLRKGLVVTQFAIAQALIIGAIVTISQLNYIRNMDLGFSKELILTTAFNNDSTSQPKLAFLKRQLLQIPSVEAVSFTSDQPISGNTWASNFNFARRPKDEEFNATQKYGDADFQKTYNLQMSAGKWFEASDTVRAYIINETMCKQLGVTPAAAVGQDFRLGSGRWMPICGVVKDFNTHSAHRAHDPLIVAPTIDYYSAIGIKVKPNNIATTRAAVQSAYDAAFPEQVFESRFLDEDIAQFYEKEAKFSAFCKAIAAIAVLIGCLGLFGLASHTATRRRKEIGVRKVLGASVGSLTGLLAKDFLWLVLMAILVAAPISVYFMQKWLADFAFRTNIAWWMVASAGVGAVLIAFLTVSFQAVKAALADPVQSLRSE